MSKKKSILLLVVIVMLLQLIIVPVANADETNYYRILQPESYKLKNVYELINTGSNEAFSVKATILVGAISNSPYQQNVSYKVTPWPKYTYVDSAGNIYAEIIIDKIKSKETKTITVEKEVVNSGISYSEEIYNMGADYTEFRKGINSNQYFEAGDKVESTASEIVAKASDFNLNSTKVELAKNIYDFVNTYITYDTDTRYANKGALSAIRTARGVCDEYATLFTALGRTLKLPARVVTGYWIDEPLEQGAWNDISSKPHAWAEFYLPRVGWIPVEPTFIYTYNGVRTPSREYFANLKTDEIHLLYGYPHNKFKNDVSISYSYYKATNVEIEIGEQAIMPVSSISNSYAFTDINNNWAKDYINQLYNNGILFAKQPGLYKPSDDISRAEFAAYLVNTLRLDSQTSGVTFKDVKDSSDYASFIKTAAAYKLITGDPQGYFKPNDPITRQDAATIMGRAIDLLDKDYEALSEPEFVDVNQVSDYAKKAVKLIYNMQIMTGKPGNLFEPKSLTTRAEVSKVLDNFINATD
ncbi:MAG: transglutaminase domain protein [Clostridia bacterium]|nr:transglutaminase domain protein [Clostridia bacterium]